jgi:ABC-type transport system substrate-binding protein
MTVRKISLALCWSIFLAFLVACSDQGLNNPYRDNDSARSIIYSSFSERPKELDPVKSYNAGEYEFIAQIYEPPLQYHFLKRPYQLVPLAAAMMPEKQFFDASGQLLPEHVEPNQVAYTEYTVTIQPGIRYQPHPAFSKDAAGEFRYHQLSAADLEKVNVLADFESVASRILTAEDYVYQIKRLAHPNLHSPLAGLLANYIHGFKAFRGEVLSRLDQQNTWLDLRQIAMSGLEVLDQQRYRIRVEGVYPQFIYWLSMPFFAPIPWEADRFYAQQGMAERNISFDWYPVGTGPYMLTENNPNLRMVLTKNPNFHGELYPTEGEPGDAERGLLLDAGKPLPFVERIEFSLEKESIPYWNKFLQGYYDTSGISSDSFDQSVELNSRGEFGLSDEMIERDIELSSAVATSLYYLGFNMLDPVVGGDAQRARLLRRAISIAVDYDEFISIFRNGRGEPAQGPIPPGIFGFEEGQAGINPYVYEWQNAALKRKSIQQAKQILSEAGYANGIDQETGKPLILYFDTVSRGADSKALLNWMVKQFAKLDIQLVIRTTDGNRFMDKLDKGTFQIYQLGWNADYPDPENFFFLLYGPNSMALSKGQNYSNYQNSDYDRLFDKMKAMENSPERLRIIRQMNDIVRADAPWVWSFYPKQYSLNHAWYQNVKPNLMANNTFKYRRVDAAKRAQMRKEWNDAVLWPVYVLFILLLLSIVPAIISYRKRELARGL